jgi:C-terminal peptidase prc
MLAWSASTLAQQPDSWRLHPEQAIEDLESAIASIAKTHVLGADVEIMRRGCIAAWVTRNGEPTESSADALRAAMHGLSPPQIAEARDACMRGVAEVLGSEARYLSPAKARISLRATPPAAVSLELRRDEGGVEVVSVVEGTPAYEAGVMAGDRVLAIDGDRTDSLALTEIVRRLQGSAGSVVSLTFIRAAQSEPRTVPLSRQVVRIRPAETQWLGDGQLLVRMNRMVDDVPRELIRSLEAMREPPHPKLTGIVLDIRLNPGGTPGGSILLASLFLPPDLVVVSLSGRDPSTARSERTLTRLPAYYAATPSLALATMLKNVPLVVLVDSRTAGAAEFLAAALQDHHRARVVGERTAGYGTVELLLPLFSDERGLDRAYMRVPSWRALRPNGESLDSIGITPDVAVASTFGKDGYPDANEDSMIEAALAILRTGR